MAHLRLVAVLIVAALCYVTLIDTAAVRSEEFAEQLQRLALGIKPETLRIQRAAENGGDGAPKRNCYNTPCGWAVYIPFTRQIDYYMKNTCECPDKTYKCVRYDEDLKTSAYVYRCRQNTTVDDIDWSEGNN